VKLPEAPRTPTIADDLLAMFRRFISAGEPELAVLALWTLHTHTDASTFTPYLSISSAEKQSGKTRVLEVLHEVVHKPLMTASISPAALARSVDKEKPTLLLDELDALLKGDKEFAEALRGILNSGFHIRGQFTRMVGTGTAMEPRQFSTFCPKAFAGIGTLPDTLANRSITIRLRRAPRSSRERFRPDGMGPAAKRLRLELDDLHKRARAWATANRYALAKSAPAYPEELQDRQLDISEPLLAIADRIGGEWPERARRALLTLFQAPAAEDTSLGVRLLTDIRDIFAASENAEITSSDLVAQLVELETSPWGEWHHGRPMTARNLASQLKKYEIFPRAIRFESGVARGYSRECFQDAWTRYVAPWTPGVTDRVADDVTDRNEVSPAIYGGCNVVTDRKGGEADRGEESGQIAAPEVSPESRQASSSSPVSGRLRGVLRSTKKSWAEGLRCPGCGGVWGTSGSLAEHLPGCKPFDIGAMVLAGHAYREGSR
jgi:hypothetical protein